MIIVVFNVCVCLGLFVCWFAGTWYFCLGEFCVTVVWWLVILVVWNFGEVG